MRLGTLAATAGLAALFASTTHAAPPPAAPPPAAPTPAARKLAETCLVCHAGAGVPNGDPAYTSPRLSGQHPDYLFRALAAYKSGERRVDVMRQQAAVLTPAQMRAVSEILAGDKPNPPKPGDANPPPLVVGVCGACHGETGLGVLPETPVLSGQRADYLAHALRAYRSGERQTPLMAVYAKRLTPAQINELSAYFARQGALRDSK